MGSSQDRAFEPLAILDKKMVKKGNRADVHMLIHWKNLSSTEAIWEFTFEIPKRFPSFSFENKGFYGGTSYVKVEKRGAELE